MNAPTVSFGAIDSHLKIRLTFPILSSSGFYFNNAEASGLVRQGKTPHSSPSVRADTGQYLTSWLGEVTSGVLCTPNRPNVSQVVIVPNIVQPVANTPSAPIGRGYTAVRERRVPSG